MPVKGVAKSVAADVRLVTNRAITYALTIGVIVALVVGIASPFIPATAMPFLTSILILAGIVIGFFNIHPNEAKDYVVLITALVIVTSLSENILGGVQVIGPYLEAILSNILAFVLPSGVIVAVRSILNLAR